MVDISIVTPPKIESTIQLADADRYVHMGPLVLEQALRNQGFGGVTNYDLSRNFIGKMAMIMDYDRSPDFERKLYGHDDVERCITSAAAGIKDSDLYLISLHIANHTSGMKLAQRLKREHQSGQRTKEGYVIVGGVSVAETTERILVVDEIDAACYGYGEDTAPQIAHFVQAAMNHDIGLDALGIVPNLYFRDRDGNYKVTPFKVPDKFVTPNLASLEKAVRAANTETLDLVGAYGCDWGRCNYCYLNSKPQHHYVKDMESIVREMESVLRIDGVSRITILDEAFLYRIDEFLAVSENRPMPQILDIDARPNHVLKKFADLERLIKEFRGEEIRVYMGTESFDQGVLDGLNRGLNASQTREATEKLIELDSKYEKFGFRNAFFLWTLGQTREGLLRGIELWEQTTKGWETPADLLKTQRYNIFAYPSFAEKAKDDFDNKMSKEERKLAVIYPYGRSVFKEPLLGIYPELIMKILPSMPFGPHEMHALKRRMSPELKGSLSSYGERLLEFPYETIMRLSLRNAPGSMIRNVIGDLGRLWGNVTGAEMNSESRMRLTTNAGSVMLNYIMSKEKIRL